jgi:hypothetical protein
MAMLATIAPILTLGAAVVGAGVSIYAATKKNENAQREAPQLESIGRDEFAAAQREALEARLQGKLVQSRQQAVAAASGGGGGWDAPTIVKLMSDTGEQTDYAAKVASYGGIQRRENLYRQADSVRRGGQSSLLGGYLSAAGTLLGGVGRYGESFA